jgi:hypothetical protein
MIASSSEVLWRGSRQRGVTFCKALVIDSLHKAEQKSLHQASVLQPAILSSILACQFARSDWDDAT